MDTTSLIIGGIAGVAVLALIMASVALFARGLHLRSWPVAAAGFALCYLICLVVEIAIYKADGPDQFITAKPPADGPRAVGSVNPQLEPAS